ncbi:MAG: hypothetical protein KME23_00490 [Goleter apudmare HA4340-LM2]|jgi:hypothetical protein|nr:hypothetical protein [Goleter apudmare HA4340-LM2]
MGKTLKEKLEQLSPERRKKIEEESSLLIAEEKVFPKLQNQSQIKSLMTKFYGIFIKLVLES